MQELCKNREILDRFSKYLKNGLNEPKTQISLLPSTVGINQRLSDLKRPGTSKLDRRYLEHNKIDRN